MKKPTKSIIIIVTAIFSLILCIVFSKVSRKPTVNSPERNSSPSSLSQFPSTPTPSSIETTSSNESQTSEEGTVVSEKPEASSATAPNNSSASVTSAKPPTSVADPDPMKTYEENKRKHEEEVRKYLEEHGIDISTAGETGEICPHCGKKIWDPDKYGFSNPGYPANYENSGYCTGACSIKVG